MGTVTAGAAGAALFGGLLLCALGVLARPAPVRRPKSRPAWEAWFRRLPRGRALLALCALITGIVLALTTGFVIAIVVLPAAVFGIPALLQAPDERSKTAKLGALAEWTRNLAGLLLARQSLEGALAASLKSAPEAIRNEVARLVSRINGRGGVQAALRAFADELDDSSADVVAAALMIAARQRGDGLSATLLQVSQLVDEEVRGRQAIEADRAKPRTNARMLVAVSLAGLVLTLFIGGFEAYSTPMGQALLAVLLTGFGISAYWLRRQSVLPETPRIFGGTA
ncbi:MAG: type II secretion system F family protein [Propionibacteriaceae bacterium]|jgi:Flp pilus assembly protein TadB|nr:type II secretion system F family protein [Propionibacteriaceae bacterium]